MKLKYPKLRELREALKAVFKGPYTSSFPKIPHVPFKRFRGRPEFNQNECVGCTACVQVCPAMAIEYRDDIKSKKRVLKIRWDLCIFCGQCQANCITGKGIELSREFDLSTDRRQDLNMQIEKELFLCECCQEPVACVDHLNWVSHKIKSLLFSNTALLLYYLSKKGLSRNPGKSSLAKGTRSDRMKILCPSCRRKAVYKS